MILFGIGHKAAPQRRNLLRTGSGQANDPPAAAQQADPAAGPRFADARLVTWHGDLAAWVHQLGWLRT